MVLKIGGLNLDSDSLVISQPPEIAEASRTT
jgi:hypothetical protein